MGWGMKLPDGTGFDEGASSLQKAVRRCEVDDAVYWALQLHEKFAQYVWRRLIVIACEDVGMANVVAVGAVFDAWSMSRLNLAIKQGGSPVDVQRQLLAVAVAGLAASSKSRECNDVTWYALREMYEGRAHAASRKATVFVEARDALYAALDAGEELQATCEALVISTGWHGWLWDSFCEYANLRIGDALVCTTMAAIRAYAFEMFTQKNGCEWNVLGYAVLLLARSTHAEGMSGAGASFVAVDDGRYVATVQDYALDQHTRRGRSKGRDAAHFLEVADELVNEAYPSAFLIEDKEWLRKDSKWEKWGAAYDYGIARQMAEVTGMAQAPAPRVVAEELHPKTPSLFGIGEE